MATLDPSDPNDPVKMFRGCLRQCRREKKKLAQLDSELAKVVADGGDRSDVDARRQNVVDGLAAARAHALTAAERCKFLTIGVYSLKHMKYVVTLQKDYGGFEGQIWIGTKSRRLAKSLHRKAVRQGIWVLPQAPIV